MYKEFKIAFTPAQGRKVLHGKPIRLSHSQLNKGDAHYFHLENYKKLVKAFESGKGTTLHMSHGEVLRTHQSGLAGSGFWDKLWSGIKTIGSEGWKFLKNNWKPILSGTLDGVAAAAGPESLPVRGMVKDLTGVGLRRRMKGGSFRLPGN